MCTCIGVGAIHGMYAMLCMQMLGACIHKRRSPNGWQLSEALGSCAAANLGMLSSERAKAEYWLAAEDGVAIASPESPFFILIISCDMLSCCVCESVE